MKFASFGHNGRHGFGLLSDDAVVDLTSKLEPEVVRLKQAISAGLLAQAGEWGGKSAELSLRDLRLLPVIPDPGKILCVGLNHEDHRRKRSGLIRNTRQSSRASRTRRSVTNS